MGGKFKPKGLHVSRKDLRKRMRKEKKEKRNNYFKNKKNIGLKLQSHNNPNNKSAKKMGKNVGVKGSLKIVPDPKNIVNQEHKDNERVEKSFIDVQNKLHKQETREKAKLERGMKNQRKKMLLEANKEEDKEIKRLEKQLKLNKRKTKAMPKSFIDEGLDWLLEVCDTDKFQESGNVQFNLQESGSEFEDDFAVVTGKGKRKLKREEVSSKKLKKNSSPKDFDKSDNGSENESCSDFSHEDDESEKNQDTSEEDNEESEDISCNVIDDNTEENEENISLDSENVSGDEDVLEGSEDENVSVVTSNEDEPEISENEDEYEDDSEDEGTSRDSGNEIIEEMENEKKRNRLEGDGNSMNDKKSVNKKKELDNGTWEDIYGRLRDKNGQILQVQEKGTYIPPHLRAKQLGQNSKKTEELARLNKQLKGLVNRLAESNLHSIANQIDELYMRNSRNDMNDSLLGLISEAVVARVLTPERLVIEHTALVAVLHANVGLEVGAHFLQRFVQRFDSLFNEAPDVEDKELDNILLIICHLYNFKVFHAVLIYNILDRLVERFTEKEVELILLVLRALGFSLRKDDPLALKDLVLRLQKKANESDHFKDNPRVKFMLDILLAVKNNNMAKIPQYDPSHSEHLKKLMKNMIHKGKYITELKITLEDLLKAEERGRWWIVGSAWAGADKTTPSLPSALPSTDSQYSQTVLDLARKQRMNTDTRRNIFCIMVTAEDYLDAFEKLLRLGLKSQQEQEIIHVMVHCVMQEKTYNPYYSHLATHFCRADRKHQMTIQYHIWDKLKELSKLSQSKISNLAKFLAHLFLEKALPISVLKVMQFSEMDKCQVRLLRQVLLSVLLHESVETVAAVFSRVSRSEKLHMFRESLRLFLHHFVLRNVSDLPTDQATMLRERVKLAETALVAADNRAKLL